MRKKNTEYTNCLLHLSHTAATLSHVTALFCKCPAICVAGSDPPEIDEPRTMVDKSFF